jgi:hypothetical protein
VGFSQYFASAPDRTFGYYRGDAEAHRYGNSGSGQGSSSAGRSVTLNGSMSGGSTGGKWHPSVAYLMGLLIAEVLLYGVVSRITRHGG